MMVPLSSSLPWLDNYALVGPQIYRNGSNYWTIQNCYIIHCAAILGIYSLISWDYLMKSEIKYLFLCPHDSVRMPWWGPKWTEIALSTELFRIPVKVIVQLF